MSTCGSSASSPLSVIASATNTTPANDMRRRSDDRARLVGLEQDAVLVEAAVRQLVDHAGIAGAELHQVAVLADDHLRHAGLAREIRMLGQVQRLAMRRDQDLRLHPGDHVAQFVAARMAGDVHQMRAVGDDLDALASTRPLMMLPTAFSLPGIVRDEKITRSPLFSVTSG